ncbi:hypothetical protein SFA35_01525 [Pseudomonas sp. HR96]|uniref:hypothetical protein n=1 Tax=Pseudomonas sp. HR96 TaxID=1027966 RepID=UPI002A75ACCA|nr:hypothetical protein [Pseudomonas sp. HR96]WPP00097.1 hypothetical protein SFA35_01525 [Pseudomonas sp. HR96]
MRNEWNDPHAAAASGNSANIADGWAVQTLVELKVAVSRIETGMGTLGREVREIKADHASTRTKLAVIEKQIYGATLLVTLVIGIGMFVINKAVDVGVDLAKGNASVQATTRDGLSTGSRGTAP